MTFGGQRQEIKADAEGRWRVDLTAMEASTTPQSTGVPVGLMAVVIGGTAVPNGQLVTRATTA